MLSLRRSILQVHTNNLSGRSLAPFSHESLCLSFLYAYHAERVVDASVGLVEGQLVGAPEQDAAGLARVQHPGHLHHALRPTGHRHFAAQLRL